MKFGVVSARYLSSGRRMNRLEGRLPLGDGFLRLGAMEGPPRESSEEHRLVVEAAEPGLRLLDLRVELEEVDLRDRFFANGFQSWSEARLVGPDDRLPGLRLLSFLKPYGDYGWVDYPGRPGCFRSHWLTYTIDGRTGGGGAGGVTFLGSLNEATAYTVFYADYRAKPGGRLWAKVDVEGLEPEPGQTLAHIFSAESGRDGGGTGQESPLLPLVRRYAARLAEVWKDEPGSPRPVPAGARRPAGWNSWYNYYGKVTAKDILAETEALAAAKLDLDFVQIDDGWQTQIGDWLEVSPRFAGQEAGAAGASSGGGAGGRVMKDLAAAIRDKGFLPGLWVAPLVASKHSEVFRRGWIKPWKAGWNPGWGSSIYALDLGRPEVVEYVRRVGDAFRDWGYGLVKADFLYAAAVRPWGGRTRAQRMREAMRLVREAMPGLLLGCGVPLASAAGLCDWCRLGSDTAAKWEDGLLSFFSYGERPSTVSALRTILGRWFMNESLFVLDPDVFILAPGQLSDTERETMRLALTALAGMQSFSDSVAALPPEALARLKDTFPLPATRVLGVDELEADLFRVRVAGGHPAELLINLGERPQRGVRAHGVKTLE